MKLCKDCEYSIDLPLGISCKRTWQSPVDGKNIDGIICYHARLSELVCGAEGKGWEAKEPEKPIAQNCPICGSAAMLTTPAAELTCCSNIGCDLFHVWVKTENWNRLRYERDKEE